MSTPETDTPTDHDAPRDTLSDTPLDAAQRLGAKLVPGAAALMLDADERDAMLDQAFFVKSNSRLGCQLHLANDMEGLKVQLAEVGG